MLKRAAGRSDIVHRSAWRLKCVQRKPSVGYRIKTPVLAFVCGRLPVNHNCCRGDRAVGVVRWSRWSFPTAGGCSTGSSDHRLDVPCKHKHDALIYFLLPEAALKRRAWYLLASILGFPELVAFVLHVLLLQCLHGWDDESQGFVRLLRVVDHKRGVFLLLRAVVHRLTATRLWMERRDALQHVCNLIMLILTVQ